MPSVISYAGRSSRQRNSWRLRHGGASVISGLLQVALLLEDSAVKQLVAEADSGRRTKALRFFFQAADAVLQELMKPENEAPPSVHQPGRAGYIEILKVKAHTLVSLGAARSITVSHEDSGFFSAWLIVLDTLLFAPPEASVTVEWRPSGTEKHFTYLDAETPNLDVWNALFQPLHRPCSTEDSRATMAAAVITKARAAAGVPAVEVLDNTVFSSADRSMLVASRWNLFLSPRFRFLLNLEEHAAVARSLRLAYVALYRRYCHVRHPAILSECCMSTGIARALERAELTIGVHKRVYTPVRSFPPVETPALARIHALCLAWLTPSWHVSPSYAWHRALLNIRARVGACSQQRGSLRRRVFSCYTQLHQLRPFFSLQTISGLKGRFERLLEIVWLCAPG